jgi:hypothetical protein
MLIHKFLLTKIVFYKLYFHKLLQNEKLIYLYKLFRISSKVNRYKQTLIYMTLFMLFAYKYTLHSRIYTAYILCYDPCVARFINFVTIWWIITKHQVTKYELKFSLSYEFYSILRHRVVIYNGFLFWTVEKWWLLK